MILTQSNLGESKESLIFMSPPRIRDGGFSVWEGGERPFGRRHGMNESRERTTRVTFRRRLAIQFTSNREKSFPILYFHVPIRHFRLHAILASKFSFLDPVLNLEEHKNSLTVHRTMVPNT